MKKTIGVDLVLRHALARRTGRMSSIAAPVVPTHEAMRGPDQQEHGFTPGVPLNEPRTKMPPDTVNNDHSRMMKGM